MYVSYVMQWIFSAERPSFVATMSQAARSEILDDKMYFHGHRIMTKYVQKQSSLIWSGTFLSVDLCGSQNGSNNFLCQVV